MILAAGLSPAWQHTLIFERLEPGEVNRAREVYHGASGKSVNVALALAACGAPVRLLTSTGGVTGRLLADDCRRQPIECRFVETRGATRECSTLIERSAGRVTELVENVAPLSAAELLAARAAFREAREGVRVVVLSGSLPAGAPPELFRAWVEESQRPVVLDTRGEALRLALPAKPWIVKPNRRELAATVGRELPRDVDVLAAAIELRDAGAENVVVTDGAGPTLVLEASGDAHWIPSPSAAVVSPIGSGDCLAAGLAWGAAEGRSLRDALPRAIALAAANCATPCPARFSADDVAASRSSAVSADALRR